MGKRGVRKRGMRRESRGRRKRERPGRAVELRGKGLEEPWS